MKIKLFITLCITSIMLSASNFTLKSYTLYGQLSKIQEFNGFGCSGANISPELHWINAPSQAKSFALTMYDPDAPTGSGWWHWLIVNIPTSAHSLEQGVSGTKKLPLRVVEIINDYGLKGFGGACPPKGDKVHQYIFTVYALDVKNLEVKSETNRAIVGYMINSHTISKSSIVSYYKR